MEEVNRFIFQVDKQGFFKVDYKVQVSVKVDNQGLYHISKRKVFPDGTTSQEFETSPEHEGMSIQDYNDWLTSCLYEMCCRHSDEEDHVWLKALDI